MCTRSVICGSRGEQAEVGVEAGGVGVVVAGAEVAVAAGGAVFVAADEHGQLAVGFEADDAVKDLDAGVFHAARPADVGGLVEAGHELDDQRGFLGGAGFGERLENGRVVAGAVEGLLHGDDGGVLSALLDEVDDACRRRRKGGGAGCRDGGVRRRWSLALRLNTNALGREGLKLEIGAADVAVEEHDAARG